MLLGKPKIEEIRAQIDNTGVAKSGTAGGNIRGNGSWLDQVARREAQNAGFGGAIYADGTFSGSYGGGSR